MITSTSNGQIKYVVQLQTKSRFRHKEACFVVEGIKMVTEAPKELVKKVYISDTLMKNQSDLTKGYDFEVVSDDVMKKMSDTVTPQGIMAVIKMPNFDVNKVLHHTSPVIIALEDLQDPGNLGTIVRTAEAVGVNGLFISSGSVDLYNPKVLRSTMGAIYHLPIFVKVDLVELIESLGKHQIKSYAAHLKGVGYHFEMDFMGGTCFLIGNEGSGLSQEIASLADEYIKIPMVGHTESLNASVAASVLMYEAFRQRHE